MDWHPARTAPHNPASVIPFPTLVCAVLVFASSGALAIDCTQLGLLPASGMVLQIREAAQGERTAQAYRDAERRAWFIPLQGQRIAEGSPDRLACSYLGNTLWKISPGDTALSFDIDNDFLTFLDTTQVTEVIDGRKPQLMPEIQALGSAGVNYQLSLNYADQDPKARLKPSAFGDFYSRSHGWYFDTTLGWANYGRVARYESYALKEWLDTGTFLRLGDAVSSPTALGESLQFAGLSWGTDRNLRPNDFSAVLPNVRSGNTLAGPIEVFINDNLQFQQQLQNGVYDLRNLPAQQGFNSYTVRTLDAQGNPVTVQREIYLPASLLPQGIQSWRVDAGFQREDFFSANAHYGAPFVSGKYSTGLSNDTTVGVQGLTSKAASTVSAGVDERLGALWTGHAGLIAARNAMQAGSAAQFRLDGGSRWWKLLADWIHASRPLPGLGDRAALVMQRLLQAQWSGITDWNLGLTMVQSRRELAAREDISTFTATTRVADNRASINLALTQVNSANGKKNNVMVSVFLPLATGPDGRNGSAYASQNSVDGTQLTRAQYSNSGLMPEDGNWSVGATRDSRHSASAADGYWSGTIRNMDLLASAHAGNSGSDAQVTMRSGMLLTEGGVYLTRPMTGAFALVSTGQEGVSVFYENRPAGRTDERGMLLVPELRAMESNRLTVDPASWPIHWTAPEVERKVIPPRGGGVLVSFRINAAMWPADSLVTPLSPAGKPYNAGTVVRATVDKEERESVIDRQGQLWIAELLPAKTFTITQAGKRCEFSMPASDAINAPIKALQCLDIP